MKFQAPLSKGTLIKRYKRFLADIELETGEQITAHCPNSGSMMGLKEPGFPVCVSRSDNPKRKLAYTLEMVQVSGTWVGVNTSWPNKLIQHGFQEGQFEAFAGFDHFKPEVKYGEGTRLDFLLTADSGKKAYGEIKNVTLKEGAGALFPDAVTARGAKHLETLMDVIKAGDQAFLVFVVQREDCSFVSPAKQIDPHYAGLLKQAVDKGVVCLCYQYTVSPEGLFFTKQLPLELGI